MKSYITDAQIHTKDYVPIRSDRSIRKGGGAILYIMKKSLSLMNITSMTLTVRLPYAFCKPYPPSCKNSMYLSSAIQLLKNNYLISHHDGCNAGPKIGDITFSQADIEEAIDVINRDASSTDHDIPQGI